MTKHYILRRSDLRKLEILRGVDRLAFRPLTVRWLAFRVGIFSRSAQLRPLIWKSYLFIWIWDDCLNFAPIGLNHRDIGGVWARMPRPLYSADCDVMDTLIDMVQGGTRDVYDLTKLNILSGGMTSLRGKIWRIIEVIGYTWRPGHTLSIPILSTIDPIGRGILAAVQVQDMTR